MRAMRSASRSPSATAIPAAAAATSTTPKAPAWRPTAAVRIPMESRSPAVRIAFVLGRLYAELHGNSDGWFRQRQFHAERYSRTVLVGDGHGGLRDQRHVRHMNWSGPSGGSWSTGGWTDTVAGGAPVARDSIPPGRTPTWRSSAAAPARQRPSISTFRPAYAAVTFSGTTAYKLAAAGGTLTLNNAGNGTRSRPTPRRPRLSTLRWCWPTISTVSGSGTLEFGPTGTITDNGAGKALTLNAAGGILELSGSNSYSGGTTVADGTLIAAENEAIQDGTNLYVGSGLSAFFGGRPRKPIAPTRQPKSQRFPNPVAVASSSRPARCC